MIVQMVSWNYSSPLEKKQYLRRPVTVRDSGFTEKVRQIVTTVKRDQDAALFEYTERFDEVRLTDLAVSRQEIQAAYSQVSSSTLSALKEAIKRVSLFHQAQLPVPVQMETSPGVRCERKHLPIQKVGLYIPGGTAPLPSTVIMLGVPSRIAGCKTRVLVTPPRPDKTIDPTILVAADLLGIQDIFKVGGAQAIAALAYGTESIPKMDKIFGPGNSWVTEAKLQVSQDPEGATCDLPAGPSEVMVIADATANPKFVAADLLSQAEHGIDSQVLLVSDSNALIQEVLVELKNQLETLPRRAIAIQALSRSHLIEVSRIEEALPICNEYAPEHLILQVKDAAEFSKGVENAGSVFIGPWTPESMGDYASGTNHVLPTYGFAKTLSGLGTESFMKSITFQELSWKGLQELGPVVEELAQTERLMGHKNAVRVRLQAQDDFAKEDSEKRWN